MIRPQENSAELDWFRIDRAYGGAQGWFTDPWMRLGGCAAVTACDSCIYFAREFGLDSLYPRDKRHLTKREYIGFSQKMKPYLRPRLSGIDRLELYTDGLGKYLKDCGETRLTMDGLPGSRCTAEADAALKAQIRAGMPVPYLNLYHEDPALRDYVWHWFLLTGFRKEEGRLQVKAVTYGAWKWLDFHRLWDTGYEETGGMVLFRLDK